jgi:hypothetical protein
VPNVETRGPNRPARVRTCQAERKARVLDLVCASLLRPNYDVRG